jgi:hypothetical protein
MSQCDSATAVLQKLDPHKRVNYTFGLVLGQDEFQQEQAYFVERGRVHQRALHGYGTVSGLQVTVADTPAGPELRVSPGIALNPRGDEICVQDLMCAKLNAWLLTNKNALQDFGFAAPGNLNLCVAICYRDCLTDTVPVPSEPCRTQKDSMVASRILDSFELKICLNMDKPVPSLPSLPSPVVSSLCFRPADFEDAGVRALGTLLSRIQISSTGTATTDQQMADAVRAIGAPGDPPPAGGILIVRPADAAARYRTLMRVWITEIQPKWNEKKQSMGCSAPSERCVLLAEILAVVNAGFQVNGGAAGVTIDDSKRPLLLSTRVLEEPILGGMLGLSSGGAFVGAPASTQIAMVAAAQFQLDGAGNATAVGPAYNNLTASRPAGTPLGGYVLNWTQFPTYAQPGGGASYSYVVEGTSLATAAQTARQVFEVLAFRPDGILIRVLDTAGALTTPGFMVQITRIGVQP